jgi:hypothetical protein
MALKARANLDDLVDEVYARYGMRSNAVLEIVAEVLADVDTAVSAEEALEAAFYILASGSEHYELAYIDFDRAVLVLAWCPYNEDHNMSTWTLWKKKDESVLAHGKWAAPEDEICTSQAETQILMALEKSGLDNGTTYSLDDAPDDVKAFEASP